MRHKNEVAILDVYYDLKDILKKMNCHREKLNEIRAGDDEEAREVATKLLETSMATSVGSIARDADLLLRTYRSATYQNKYLRRDD